LRRLRIPSSSIVTKLILVNLILLLTVGGVVIISFVLTRQFSTTLNELIDNEVSRVIDNAALSRNLNHVFAETQLLLNTFTHNNDILKDEGQRLLTDMSNTVSVRSAEDPIRKYLIEFHKHLKLLFEQCTYMVQITDEIQFLEREIEAEITALDNLVTKIFIRRTVEGKDYELYSLEDISASIPDYRSILLQIALEINTVKHAYYGSEEIKWYSSEQQVLSLFTDLIAGLNTVNTSGAELSGPGRELIESVQLYQEKIIIFYQEIHHFQTLFSDLNKAQGLVISEIAGIDEEISRTSSRIKDILAEKINSSRGVMILLLIIVIILMISSGIHIVRLTQPIIILTKSAAKIAAGNLDIQINQRRDDEIGQLARSFIHMRDAIKQQIGTLKNEIDERKRIEQALRESEGKFRAAFEQAFVGIAMVDINGRFIQVNNRLCNILGYSMEELLDLDFKKITHPEDIKIDMKYIQLVLKGDIDTYIIVKRYIHKTGRIVWIQLYSSVFRNNEGKIKYAIAVVDDITERKLAEEKLHAALEEKEVLLRELYHRTKNNMQVIRSLLMLQSESLKTPEVETLVHETEKRIQAMALVHQMLYQSNDLSRIRLDEYLQNLIPLLRQSHNTTFKNINLILDVREVTVIIDTAIPCGLILNEIITNAFKHAFPDNRKGEVKIRLLRNESGLIELHVSDNGIGVPKGFDFRNQQTLGLQTIFAIAEQQLQGKIIVELNNGVSWHISFKDNIYTPGV